MGGGISGGSNKSGSRSKPGYSPVQKDTFQWMFGNVMPFATGKEDALSQLMSQQGRDASAAQFSPQPILGMAGQAGYGAGQVGGQWANQQAAIRTTLANVMAARQARQQGALNMIGNIPMGPGQKTRERTTGWDFEVSGGKTGGG